MKRDDTILNLIPDQLYGLLLAWHRYGKGWRPNISWPSHSAGFATGGSVSGWDDLEAEVDHHAMRMIDRAWAMCPADGKVVIEVAMGWLPGGWTIRRQKEVAAAEVVAILMRELHKTEVV